MKSSYVVLFLLVVGLAAYPFLNPSSKHEVVTGLPWQIDVLADGSTQVFGLNIGRSRLAQAAQILDSDMEVAIIAATDEVGKLEMYFASYRAGLLSGKLILQTKPNKEKLSLWRENSIKSDYVATGRAKKYALSREHRLQALEEIITAVVFIPSVNLDEEIILARFGQAEERLVSDEGTRYLYPKLGLEVSLLTEGKAVLLYRQPSQISH